MWGESPAKSGSQGGLVRSLPLLLEGQVLLPAADQAYLHLGLAQTWAPLGFIPTSQGSYQNINVRLNEKNRSKVIDTTGPYYRIKKSELISVLLFLTLCCILKVVLNRLTPIIRKKKKNTYFKIY